MTAARTHRLSPFVHAVDSTGSLCRARPRHGKWRLTEYLPVNCPKCLMRLGRPRYATCETSTAGSTSPIHIRRVGPEGIELSGNAAGSRTLCGQLVGWDLHEVPVLDRAFVKTAGDLCVNCSRIAVEPHLESLRV